MKFTISREKILLTYILLFVFSLIFISSYEIRGFKSSSFNKNTLEKIEKNNSHLTRKMKILSNSFLEIKNTRSKLNEKEDPNDKGNIIHLNIIKIIAKNLKIENLKLLI